MNTSSTKNIVQSKTFWGIVVAVLPTVLRLLGVPVPPGIEDVLVAAGASLGIYGRVAATERVMIRRQ